MKAAGNRTCINTLRFSYFKSRASSRQLMNTFLGSSRLIKTKVFIDLKQKHNQKSVKLIKQLMRSLRILFVK